jgi:hypothetical protein
VFGLVGMWENVGGGLVEAWLARSAWFAAACFGEEQYGGGVAAASFLQVAGAVAADFACVVLCDNVGAVVADDVVDVVA